MDVRKCEFDISLSYHVIVSNQDDPARSHLYDGSTHTELRDYGRLRGRMDLPFIPGEERKLSFHGKLEITVLASIFDLVAGVFRVESSGVAGPKEEIDGLIRAMVKKGWKHVRPAAPTTKKQRPASSTGLI